MRLPRFALLRCRYEGLSPSGQSVKGVRNDIIQPRRKIATGLSPLAMTIMMTTAPCAVIPKNRRVSENFRHPPSYLFFSLITNYFKASATATAQATVIPTIGLLPAPISPIIST